MYDITSGWEQLKSYFKGFPEPLVDGGLAAIVGIFVGFLMKNFGRYIFFSLLMLAITLYGLNYFNFITMHTEQIQQFFGVTELPSVNRVISDLMAFVQQHIAMSIGAVLGFFIGWKLGN